MNEEPGLRSTCCLESFGIAVPAFKRVAAKLRGDRTQITIARCRAASATAYVAKRTDSSGVAGTRMFARAIRTVLIRARQRVARLPGRRISLLAFLLLPGGRWWIVCSVAESAANHRGLGVAHVLFLRQPTDGRRARDATRSSVERGRRRSRRSRVSARWVCRGGLLAGDDVERNALADHPVPAWRVVPILEAVHDWCAGWESHVGTGLQLELTAAQVEHDSAREHDQVLLLMRVIVRG
jgi:hypothetical protein